MIHHDINFFSKKPQLFIYLLFICFWLCQVSAAAHGLSLVVVSGGYSPAAGRGIFTAVVSLVVDRAWAPAFGLNSCVAHGFSCPSAYAIIQDW